MLPDLLIRGLRFCRIIDCTHAGIGAGAQARQALCAGVTMIRYATQGFSTGHFTELVEIRNLCRANGVSLLIDDDPVLARAVDADGLHLEGGAENIDAIRRIVGAQALIGLSVSIQPSPACVIPRGVDFLSVSLPSGTQEEARQTAAVLTRLKQDASQKALPVAVVIGSDIPLATRCMQNGAAGITLSPRFLPETGSDKAFIREMGLSLGCTQRPVLALPWQDEFRLIRRLIGEEIGINRPHPAVRVPPGGDTCLLEALAYPVISTDTQRHGVHFRFDWQTPEEVGEKAVSVALSDLAASYATPAALFVNLCLPDSVSEETVVRVYRGMAGALTAYGCALGGGNISGGDTFGMDLFAVGEGRADIFPERSAARPGFGLYTTGELGMAAAGLEALKRGDDGFPELIRRFKAPLARFDAAVVLANHGVRCVLDISDGLAGDAGHIATASGVSIDISEKDLRVEDEMKAFCRKYGLSPETMALSGGEDYELLFACFPETFASIKKELPKAFQVGNVLDFQGRHLLGKAAEISSFQHGLR